MYKLNEFGKPRIFKIFKNTVFLLKNTVFLNPGFKIEVVYRLPKISSLGKRSRRDEVESTQSIEILLNNTSKTGAGRKRFSVSPLTLQIRGKLVCLFLNRLTLYK